MLIYREGGWIEVSLLVREGEGEGEERLPGVEKRWPASRKSVNL
jgi:hypothetical protein